MTNTSGTLAPKIRLYNPNGELNASASNFDCGAAPVEMNTVTLPSTGTYVVLVGDCSDTNTGNYEIYSQLTNAPGGSPILPLLFGQSQPDTLTTAAQSNTYTFSANANDVIDITMTNTSGSLAPKIRLYNPNGALNTSSYNFDCGAAPVEMNTATLPTTGTYTVLVGDCSDTNTGNYVIYSQRINNPSRASALSLGQTMSGLIASAAKNNTYTFSANASDVIDITMSNTSGSLAPKIRLYNPSGALNTSASNFDCGAAPVEMNTVTLPSTGTYTVLVADCSDTNTGNYEIYSQRTNKPVGGVDFVFGGGATPGSIGNAAQSNTYIFGGTAGTAVDITMTNLSGTLAPKLRLYNPDGSLAGSASNFDCGAAPAQLNVGSLAQTGLFTLLAGDCSDINTGNYNISGQCIGGTCTAVLSTPTVTVTPSSPYLTTAQAVPVTVTVSGGSGPTPTGSVTLSGGGYTSSPGTLSSGTVSFNIPPGTLSVGNDTLTATYTPDAGSSSTYSSATGSVPVTVVSSTFSCASANPNPNPNPESFANPGDFNADCKSDVLWRNSSTGQVYEWFMNGTSTLSAGTPGGATSPWTIVGEGDFNGDGMADILWRNSTTGQVYIWLMNGHSIVTQASPGTVTTDWAIAGVGDFNGDGKADILWQNSTSGQVYIWIMNGTAIASAGSPGTVASGWNIQGVGDFNDDGRADVLWQNSTSGQVYVWLMNGTAIASQASPGTVASGWNIEGVGVFNGDGNADIVWRNSTSGQVYLWLMNGTAVVSQASPGSATTDWAIESVGDFNGDGDADVLWRNSTTGQTYIWLMNGTTITGQASPGSATSAWQIVSVN